MRRIVQTVGAVFALIAFVLLLVSLVTSYWVNIKVDGTTITSGGLAAYSRHRGLYKECWTDDSLKQVIQTNQYSSSDMCVTLIHVWQKVPTNQAYHTSQGLLVAMWTVTVLAVVLIFIAMLLFLYTLCQHINNYQWKHGTKAAAGCMLAAVFLNALGMSFFHGADYLENYKASDPDSSQAPYPMYFPANQSPLLLERTTRTYSWGYAFGWCAIACELLSSVLFMVISCCYVKSKKKSVYTKPAPKHTTVIVGARNPAYEVVHERVVVAPPQVYVVNGNDHYSDRGDGYSYRDGAESYNSYNYNTYDRQQQYGY